MEGSEPQQAEEPPPNRKNLLRRVPVGVWVVLALLVVGLIANTVGGDTGSSDTLAVGDCLTDEAEPEDVSCNDEEAGIRITQVFEGASSATQASLGCPEGSEVIELRGAFEDDDDLPEMAGCVEPLP